MRNPSAERKPIVYPKGSSPIDARRVPTLLTLFALTLLLISACSQPEQVIGAVPTVPDVSAWDWATIGYTDPGMSSEVLFSEAASGNSVVVSGTGTDIFGESDKFVFAYTPLPEDGYLEARLQDFSAPAEWSKAGIMIRGSLDPSSENALVHVSGENGAVFQVRDGFGATTRVVAWDPGREPATTWLRLGRVGGNAVAELSADGVEWAPFASHALTNEGPALIGFAVAANAASSAEAAIATFSDLELNVGRLQPRPPGSPPGDPAPPGDDPAVPPGPAPAPPRGFDLPPATLYVSPQGLVGNSGREEDRPTTLGRAAEIVRPGDVVYLRGGTYPVHVNFLRSGTREAPIIWASHPGEWAVLDGSGSSRGRSNDRVFVSNVSWNVFANFEVRSSPNQGILVSNSHDNVFFGLVSRGNHGSGIQLIDADRNRLEKVIVYDNFDDQNSRGQPGQDADGIGISSGDGNVILNCVSYFNSDDGVDLWRSTNSLIDGCISFGNGRGAYGNGNGFKLGGPVPASNSTIQRSIAFSNEAAGFTSNGARQVTVRNNTSYDNRGSNFVGTSSTVFQNNVSASGRVHLNGATSRNDSWGLGISDVRFASVDASSELFLSLSSASPARESGVDVGLAFTGSAPDIGALQHPQTWVGQLDNGLFDMRSALHALR